jgi:hypothetical protein
MPILLSQYQYHAMCSPHRNKPDWQLLADERVQESAHHEYQERARLDELKDDPGTWL